MTRLTGLLSALVLVAALAAAPGPAAAEDARESAVRSVIEAQIEAFRADDGSTAYSFAAPSIREMFTSPETFMAMVKSGYQPVYRPRSVAWGRLFEERGALVQEVFVTGPDGEPYTALYAMQRQPDGSWKIAGCRIVKSEARSA